MAPTVIFGGIHLVNSTGTPIAGGAATAAATTPFAIDKGWRPMPAPPIVVQGSQTDYPDMHYEPIEDTPIPVAIIGSSHENAVARRQELIRAITPANSRVTILEIQEGSSSTAMQAEIISAYVRDVTEPDSGFEGWEGFATLYVEIVYTRSAFFARSDTQDSTTIVSGATMTNTGTGVNPNIQAYASSLDGDLANEGQPTRLVVTPAASGANTIYYVASIYDRTYSTTGSGAKNTSSTTGASSALNAPSIAAALTRQGIKLRVMFRFTNNTSNVQVRYEMKANTGGTVLAAGKWITPTSGSATLYDMGRIPIDLYRTVHGLTTSTVQLYIGYRSTDGASATATLGYNELLFYYDFCRIDSPTPVNSASGSTGYRLELYNFMYNDVANGNRPLLPLDAPLATVFDVFASHPVDTAVVRGRAPRAIEGGSLYLAWTLASNVHDTTKTATVNMYHAPLWRSLRGSD